MCSQRVLTAGVFSLSLTLLLLCVTLCLRMGEAGGNKLTSVDFEIFGNVQGVCFRMYTEKQGLHLGLVGWVKNTHGGTVVGQVQGPTHKVEEMKVWLSKEGSPSSRITRFCFSNQRNIDKLELSGFKTRF
ncbi:acylphosphatase-2 [Trematomus bernacchii]|uniref:acylphosphatase-2 n=1 Tax=Trematomus bernacchii TaxID=40690 RepID=UPI00146D5CE7|nr:acylphosphatase-2 [Trematomus bernacchii]